MLFLNPSGSKCMLSYAWDILFYLTIWLPIFHHKAGWELEKLSPEKRENREGKMQKCNNTRMQNRKIENRYSQFRILYFFQFSIFYFCIFTFLRFCIFGFLLGPKWVEHQKENVTKYKFFRMFAVYLPQQLLSPRNRI